MARLTKNRQLQVDKREAREASREHTGPGLTSNTTLSDGEVTKGGDVIEDAELGDDPVTEGQEEPDLDEQLEKLSLETALDVPPPQFTGPVLQSSRSSASGTASETDRSAKLKATWCDVRHWAGGLVVHPYEATKHYSILRHSHGLVYYRGPATKIAITILSDEPLPLGRRLWLQKRGFSGKTGLKIGSTLGTRSAWIDVTPAVEAAADRLPQTDERAWQRDIGKFLKKTKDVKNVRGHRPCETDVVRIPHIADDGYFRIVLCAGRKVLCPSPMFRYVTASLDPGRLRGASLSSLPLELGIKIGALAARHAANTAAHGALLPVSNAYQNQVQPIVQKVNPLGLTKNAAMAVYDSSGAQAKVTHLVDGTDRRYKDQQDLAHRFAAGDAVEGAVQTVGNDDGPESPFPIRFSGKVVLGPGRNQGHLGVPTAILDTVPEDLLLRLSGNYFGWATISKTKVSKSSLLAEDAYDVWYPALVTVAPLRDAQANVIEKKHTTLHLVNDLGEATFLGARANVLLLGFLRPAEAITPDASSDPEGDQVQMAMDISVAQASLDRPEWLPEAVLERVKSRSSQRSITEKLGDAREMGQRQIDRVPFHLLGVKTNSMGLRDQLIGNGGIFVRR